MNTTIDRSHFNPFPGLRPFREDEEHLFFGRENQVDAMVNKLAETRFLAVVGTSGSGKSSLVNCGLRPALRQGLMARAGTAWRMAQFRPGNDPIGAMACALAQDGVLFRDHAAADLSIAEIIEATLRMSKLGLIDICEQAALDEGVNLLVVVDQFEELFRYRQLGDQRIAEQAAAFVNLLLEVKERANCPIYVVLTMRSDFLGDCTQFPGLAEAINAGQYLVPRMTRDERRAAIERPVGVGGAEMSPVLLTRLVNDVGDNPDQLSILQHALNRTWARWQSEGGKGPLDLPHYEAIGTMAHALDQHAEKAYAELSNPRQQQICERLFKALTDKTDPRGLRRPTTLAILCALADATGAEVIAVIDVFRKPSRSFLMPPAGDALKAETVIDISHESLMRVWERLIKWADDEAASARSYRRMAEVAELHAAGNANLWRDPELQLALNWRDKNQPNETWASRYHPGFAAATQFLTDSGAARDAERAERQLQRQRELDAEHDKAETQARNARRMLWATVVSSAFAVVAIAGGVLAYKASVTADASRTEAEKNRAEAVKSREEAENSREEAQRSLREAQITRSRSLVEKAEQDSNNHSRKILLALAALPDAREGIERPAVFDAQTILSGGINDLRELAVFGRQIGPVLGVAVTRDGVRVVTGSDDGTAQVWDASTGATLNQLKGHDGPVRSVAVTPDGTRIISGADDNSARVWDGRTGTELRQLRGHDGPVRSLAVTSDGTRIITGSDDGTARVWDASTGAELLQLKDHTGPVAVTPDGARIITCSADNTARVWDASTGAELLQLKGHDGPVRAVAVTLDGARIITGSADNTARVWDASTGAELHRLKGHDGSVLAVAVTPDGTRIVTGSADKTARVWDASSGAELLQVTGHTDSVLGVAITPDATRIVTRSDDNTARMWDARTGTAMFWLKGHIGLVRSVALTADGARIVTGSADRTARVWDARTGAELHQLKGHDDSVLAVAVTPDGARIVTGSADKTARVWDASTGAELHQLKGHDGSVLAVAVTPDGARIVTGSADKTVRVWDASTGVELLQLKGHDGSVRGVAVTPDGARFVTGSDDRTARVWDSSTGVELLKLKGHARPILAVAVTRDGARVITGSSDTTARVWDASTGAELFRLRGHNRSALDVAVTPDGARIIIGSDNTAWVWALAQLRPLPQQNRFDTATNRQAVVDRAKAVVPRCLTVEERKDFLLRPTPPGWCIDMRKYPYDTEYWRAWRAKKEPADSSTAEAYADFADKALMRGGAIGVALEAAELSIKFDPPPKKIWFIINQAHAHMFLGQTEKARQEYLSHHGEKLEMQSGKLWDTAVVEDFQKLRENGLGDDLMVEIEQQFKSALPVEADK